MSWKQPGGAAVVAAMLAASAAHAQAPEPAPVVTQQRITVDGKPLAYTAEAGRIAIRDVVTGKPHAYMFYAAYRVATKGKPRPVTFLWGGGPGQPGLGMDFTLAGPRRAGWFMGKPGELVDNPDTLLTDTDLVFVDEVGSGWSRATEREYVAEFNGTIGDTDSFAEFIRAWRVQHDAQDAPVIVSGPSWGAPRAGTVAYALQKKGVPVAGAALVSGETQINNLPIPMEMFKALRVVGMSTVAARWKKLSPDLGTDVAKINAEARTWAVGTYAPALTRIGALSPAEREEIAKGLSRYTGVKAALIDRETLEIPPKDFQTKLLIDEGKVLNGAETRLAGPTSEPSSTALYLAYVRNVLGYKTDMPYLPNITSTSAGYAPFRAYDIGPWEYATSPVTAEERKAAKAAPWAGPPLLGDPLPSTAEAMMLNPKMKVLVVITRWDGASTCESNQAVHEALPPVMKQAMVMKCYESGHSIRLTPGIQTEFRRDIADLVRRIDQDR